MRPPRNLRARSARRTQPSGLAHSSSYPQFVRSASQLQHVAPVLLRWAKAAILIPDARGRTRAPPPERRIHPAAPVRLAGLPDESGVPVGMAASLGGGIRGRPTRAANARQVTIERVGSLAQWE